LVARGLPTAGVGFTPVLDAGAGMTADGAMAEAQEAEPGG